MTDATTTEQPAMQIDICELIAKFSKTLTDSQCDFESAYRETENAQATIEKFGKAAEAAEAEGKAISPQIREIYRNGGSEKDAVKLKVKQREAFENAEIMLSIKNDGIKALARAKLNAQLIAESIKSTRDVFLGALEDYLEKRLAEVLPQDVWLYMDVVAYRAKMGFNAEYNSRPDFDDIYEYGLRQFGKLVSLKNEARRKQPVTDLLPPLPSGFSYYGEKTTPLQLQKMRDEVDRLESLEEEVQ